MPRALIADNNWRVGWKSSGRSVRSYRRMATAAPKIKTSAMVRAVRDENNDVWNISRSILSDSVFYLSPENIRWRCWSISLRSLLKPTNSRSDEINMFKRAKAVGGWKNKARNQAPKAGAG